MIRDITKFPTTVLNVIQQLESFLIQLQNNAENVHQELNTVNLQKHAHVNVKLQDKSIQIPKHVNVVAEEFL